LLAKQIAAPQAVPAATGVVKQPVAGSQPAIRQGLPSVVQILSPPAVQTPCWQVAPAAQAS
jgi:hypothetical protein